ncbi:MAG: hypothetical protein AAF564_19290 [Bacteroidota bacterium]
MDKKLQLIRHLYGESEDRDTPLRDLLQDDALKHEYQELNESKFWLDHTMHERPEQDVLDKIFAAAQQASDAAPPAAAPLNLGDKHNRRADRAPVANKPKTRRRLFAPVAGVLMLLATVGIGYQLLLSPDAELNQIASQQLNKSVAPESADRAPAFADSDVMPNEEATASRFEQPPAPEALMADIQLENERSDDVAGLTLSSATVADTSLPEWNDDLDDVLKFQRRIDMLLEQNQDLAWDEAAVPLELLPASRPANPAVRQAGSRRTSGNQ